MLTKDDPPVASPPAGSPYQQSPIRHTWCHPASTRRLARVKTKKKEMQSLDTPPPTESETLGIGPGTLFYQDLQVILIIAQV